MNYKDFFIVIGIILAVGFVSSLFVDKSPQEPTNLGWLTNDLNPITSTTQPWDYANYNYGATGTDFTTAVNYNMVTTTVSGCKSSLYRPTSTDRLSWFCATNTDALGYVGTPTKIAADAKGGRRWFYMENLEITSVCVFPSYNISSGMKCGTATTGIPVGIGETFELKGGENLYQGPIYAMAPGDESLGSDATGTIYSLDARE